MIRRDQAGEREHSFYVDVDLSDAEPIGLKIGRFYDRHPLGRKLSGHTASYNDGQVKTRVQAAHVIAQWTHGAHIVGAIPSYDTETDVRRMLAEAGLVPAWHHHLIDVEALAVGFLAGRRDRQNQIVDDYPQENGGEPAPGLVRWAADTTAAAQPPWNSDELTAALGLLPVPDDERHTALGDCRWALRIYDRVMGAE